jgi:hypothetical protein
MITSIFTPETINLIYQTFQELKDLPITQWSIGLNFLENKNFYDSLILKETETGVFFFEITSYGEEFGITEEKVKSSFIII